MKRKPSAFTCSITGRYIIPHSCAKCQDKLKDGEYCKAIRRMASLDWKQQWK